MNYTFKSTKMMALLVILGLSFLSFGVILVRSNVLNEVRKTDEENPVPSTIKNTSVKETYIKSVCWEGEPALCMKDAWEWRTYAAMDWQTLTLKLGDLDRDGEIRYLYLRNASGAIRKVGQLTQDQTYISTISEMDGSPVNRSPNILGQEGNPGFRIEVYHTSPKEFFDYRLPILVKYIQVPSGFIGETGSNLLDGAIPIILGSATSSLGGGKTMNGYDLFTMRYPDDECTLDEYPPRSSEDFRFYCKDVKAALTIKMLPLEKRSDFGESVHAADYGAGSPKKILSEQEFMINQLPARQIVWENTLDKSQVVSIYVSSPKNLTKYNGMAIQFDYLKSTKDGIDQPDRLKVINELLATFAFNR